MRTALDRRKQTTRSLVFPHAARTPLSPAQRCPPSVPHVRVSPPPAESSEDEDDMDADAQAVDRIVGRIRMYARNIVLATDDAANQDYLFRLLQARVDGVRRQLSLMPSSSSSK